MSWIIFSVIAAFLVACSDIVDKFIVEKYTKNAGAIVLFFSIMNFIYAISIYMIFKTRLEFSFVSLVALVGGGFLALSSITRFTALGKEEVSRIAPLYATTPLVVAVFAKFFLNESFGAVIYLGIVFVILGAFLLSFRIEKGLPKKIPILGVVLLGVLILGIGNIAVKWSQFTFNFWTFLFYGTLGYGVMSSPLWIVKKYRNGFVQTFVKNKMALASILFSEIFALTGISLFDYTLALGPASIITSLYSLKMFFVFLIATIFGIRSSNLLREDLNKSTIIIKLAAIILIFAGVYLLALR